MELFNLLTKASRLISITAFNVLNLNAGRETEILSTLNRPTIIGLQGTCRRSESLTQVQTVFNCTCVVFRRRWEIGARAFKCVSTKN